MLTRLLTLLLCLAVTIPAALGQSQVTNPRTLPNEWPLYGVGDPYILKYRGQYYLYCSTRDDLTGVKVWSSWDLATWTYQGLCATDPITRAAYAPEVLYVNGTFYMNTSPGGQGHYILSSASPIGPFVVATGNQGRSIDGNMFRDDNGQLYFTYAGTSGILGATMSTPLAIDGSAVNTGASLAGWTEGSTLFKRNGLYYLTYTGNHVISPGYRVNYATSTNPLGPFSAGANGPLLLSSEGTFYGLGHSGSVQGPDLDTWYMAYHNKIGDAGKGPIRQLNIDPMAFNGSKLLVYGPTNWAQPAPALPTFYDRFDRPALGAGWTNTGGGTWTMVNQELLEQSQTTAGQTYQQLTTATAGADYTAEFNLREVGRGSNAARLGAVFNYQDANNFGKVQLSSFDNTLATDFVVNGTAAGLQAVPLPPGWDYQKWHVLRVEKAGTTFRVYIDGMLKATRTVAGLSGGSIGVSTLEDRAQFGYLAFTNQVNGSAIFDFAKPIPGTLDAAHYNAGGEAVGYHDTTPGNTGGYRTDDVDLATSPEGGYAVTGNATGEWYQYNVNVQAAGAYHLGLRYAAAAAGGQVRLKCDGVDVSGTVALPATATGAGLWRTVTLENLTLPAGYHTLRLETVSGGFDFYSLQFTTADPSPQAADDFSTSYSSGWNYTDGTWAISAGRATLNGFGKRAIGNVGWTDYTVEVDVQCPAAGNAGLIFRTRNPANGAANNNPQAGTDFQQGYYAGLGTGGVTLGRQNYNWTALGNNSQALTAGQWYHLRAVVQGARIKIYRDNLSTPIIDLIDNQPLISGKAGLRVFNANTAFDNFLLGPVASALPMATERATAVSTLRLAPNPTANFVDLSWDGQATGPAELSITDVQGRLIQHESVASVSRYRLPVDHLANGMYFVTVRTSQRRITAKLVINRE
jgi:xylan 1,4-beta-xylosidase